MSMVRVTLAGLQCLRTAVGAATTVRVAGHVLAQQVRGEPFGPLPAGSDWRERGSRQQAGEAVRLYRALRSVRPPEEALRIAAAVIEAGGVRFLQDTIGPLRRSMLETLDPEERKAFLADRGGRFPNATPVWERTGPEAVSFTISACRLVSLVQEAGHPELAPLFCASDARFFGTVEPNVVLDRPETIASGSHRCRFHLTWVS